MVSKEAENILRKVLQPRKNLTIGKGERLLVMESIHIDIMTTDHHPIAISVHGMEISSIAHL
jgi:hypothetical protein